MSTSLFDLAGRVAVVVGTSGAAGRSRSDWPEPAPMVATGRRQELSSLPRPTSGLPAPPLSMGLMSRTSRRSSGCATPRERSVRWRITWRPPGPSSGFRPSRCLKPSGSRSSTRPDRNAPDVPGVRCAWSRPDTGGSNAIASLNRSSGCSKWRLRGDQVRRGGLDARSLRSGRRAGSM